MINMIAKIENPMIKELIYDINVLNNNINKILLFLFRDNKNINE